jgi:hypothetical protein
MNKDLIDNLLKSSSMITNKLRSDSADWFIDNPMVSNIINDFLKEERHNIRKEKIKRIFDEKK